MTTHEPRRERITVLILSTVLFIASCMVAAVGLYLAGIPMLSILQIDAAQVLIGLALTLPLFTGLVLIRRSHRHSIRELWDLPVELLGPALSRCTVVELVLIATMAGIGEELLFRGFLQHWLVMWNVTAGLILPSILFGLLHSLSTAYAVGACLVGLYFASLHYFVPSIQLTALIVAHAVYDLVALYLARRFWLSRHSDTCRTAVDATCSETLKDVLEG